MGLMEKIRKLVSPNSPSERGSNASEHGQSISIDRVESPSRRDPTLSTPKHDHDDPLIAAQDSGSDQYTAPILDDEWELYPPAPPINTTGSSRQSSDNSPFEGSLDLSSDLVDQFSPAIANQDQHPPHALSHQSITLQKPSPETELFDELAPPIILDESLDGQELVNPENLQIPNKESVFVPSNRHANNQQKPQVSLALLPVAIPSPLSYALAYRDHIDYHLSQDESEQDTTTLLKLFNLYLSLVPNDLQMWQSYSEVMIETQGLEYAYNEVKNALGKTRDDTGLLLMLADMSRRMCDTHTAWHHISILNELHPNNIDVLIQLRDIQRECKFYELAENTDAHIDRLLKGQERPDEYSSEQNLIAHLDSFHDPN